MISHNYIIKKENYFLKKYEILLNFGWFLCEFITIIFCYPDPDARFLEWIRISNTEWIHVLVYVYLYRL